MNTVIKCMDAEKWVYIEQKTPLCNYLDEFGKHSYNMETTYFFKLLKERLKHMLE